MSLDAFFSPVSAEFVESLGSEWLNSQYRMSMEIYTETFPDLDNDYFDIAIVGVSEERGAKNNIGVGQAANAIRKQLYTLHEGSQRVRIIDMGNIKKGKTLMDSYFALKIVLSELIKRNIFPIIIGGSHDITYAQFLAYEALETKVDLGIIDSKIDLQIKDVENSSFDSQSFINAILLHEPNYLFNLSVMGYQTYFVSQESVKTLDELYFDTYRLGDFVNKMEKAEPMLRNADLISFDLSAIRYSDAPANENATPNGLSGGEACQMCRYAGMSDKLSSMGFYEYNPRLDPNGQTALLIAQMIWYLIEGVSLRKSDFPSLHGPDYLTYRVPLPSDNFEITFVKSKKSDRWWMQVPYPDNGTTSDRHIWIPCSYEDYLNTSEGDMPILWWKAHQKLS